MCWVPRPTTPNSRSILPIDDVVGGNSTANRPSSDSLGHTRYLGSWVVRSWWLRFRALKRTGAASHSLLQGSGAFPPFGDKSTPVHALSGFACSWRGVSAAPTLTNRHTFNREPGSDRSRATFNRTLQSRFQPCQRRTRPISTWIKLSSG